MGSTGARTRAITATAGTTVAIPRVRPAPTSSSFATTTGRTTAQCPTRYRYYRGGYLPPGWRTRVVPVPVYLEPQFVAVPYGYNRGFIDGHAVVYNSRGFILDIAAVF